VRPEHWLYTIPLRLRSLFRREYVEQELDDEIQFHLDQQIAENIAKGLAPKEARLAAIRAMEGLEMHKEECRDMRRVNWIEDALFDFHYGLRTLRKNPGFTAVAVLTLALGIGANAAIFTALDATLWRLLPVTDPQGLVSFSISDSAGPEETDLPLAFVEQLRESGIFAGITTTSADGLSFTYDDRAERIIGETVSPNYFRMLGVQPILGQGFTPDVQAGHWAAEAVLSYGFWKQRFGGDPTVIGHVFHLNSYPFTVVGVSPPSFFGLARGTDYELRIPILPAGQEVLQISQISGSPDRWLDTTARLKPGQTLEQTQTEADAQLQRFLSITSNRQIQEFKQAHIRLTSEARGDYERVGQFRAPLYLLLVLAAIVLLVACVNLANMLLARAVGRSRELAIRNSMGAGRSRLIRQMITESMLLAFLGGAVGIALSKWTASLLARFVPQGHITIALDLRPDNRTFAFTTALSLLTILIFGVLPAIRGTRGDLAATLKSDSAASIGGSRGGLRKILVVSQVAFSFVLLVIAAVFVSALSNLRPRDFRSDPNHVLLFTMKPQQEIYTADRKRKLVAELLRRVTTLRGVQAAALAENGPLGSRYDRSVVESVRHDQVRADVDQVTPQFFDAVGIPWIVGRDFDLRDTTTSPPVAIVNQSFAHAMYKGENPIGQTFSIMHDGQAQTYEVIGVVADAHYYELHAQPRPGLWLALLQRTPYMPTLHVRYSGSDGAAVMAAVIQEFNSVDKGFPVFNIKTLELRIEDSLWRERMVTNLAAAFGFLAISLAAVGLYGVLSYTVSRRTREIGIRMALGASSQSVLWIVARETITLAGAGIVFGIGAALGTERLLGKLFNGISFAGLSILMGCAALMLVVATVAVSIPAMRACQVDPLVALRYE
jgi:predicted permease